MTPPNSSDEESDGANSFVVASQMRPNDYSHVPDWLQLTQSTNPDDQMEDIKWVRVIENGSSKKVKRRNGKLFFKFYAKCTICANDPFECNTKPGRGEWLEPRSWFRSRVLEQHETCLGMKFGTSGGCALVSKTKTTDGSVGEIPRIVGDCRFGQRLAGLECSSPHA